MCLYQSYERREIAKIKWINGDGNPINTMTGNELSSALKWLIDTNQIELKIVK